MCIDKNGNPDDNSWFPDDIAQSICNEMFIRIENGSNEFLDGIYTIYSELYGGKLPASKQYTTSKAYDVRTFDIMYIPMQEFKDLHELQRDKIASWREHGGQAFFDTDDRCEFCNKFFLQRVPFIENIYGEEVPTDISETYEFLTCFRKSKAGIDYANGRSEGIVIRSDGRSKIVKLRFEDYERTLNIRRT